jgi:hypothetical protein
VTETDPWAVGTWAGAQAVQRRAVAALSPTERLAWLEEALDAAAALGALDAARQAAQDRADALWWA